MTSASTRTHPRSRHSDETRERALGLLAAGESIAAVSRQLGPQRDTIKRWAHEAGVQCGKVKQPEQDTPSESTGRVVARVNGTITIEGEAGDVGIVLATMGYDAS